MKKVSISLTAMLFAAVLPGAVAMSAEGPAEKLASNLVKTVSEGCQQELDTYCKNVTPGQARILACLYAYNDQLSARCEYALYDAAAELDNAISKLTYVAEECEDDLAAYCANVEVGGGRLLDCLKKNKDRISEGCNQALEDTNLK
jgi:hypothetical protein